MKTKWWRESPWEPGRVRICWKSLVYRSNELAFCQARHQFRDKSVLSIRTKQRLEHYELLNDHICVGFCAALNTNRSKLPQKKAKVRVPHRPLRRLARSCTGVHGPAKRVFPHPHRKCLASRCCVLVLPLDLRVGARCPLASAARWRTHAISDFTANAMDVRCAVPGRLASTGMLNSAGQQRRVVMIEARGFS